MTKAQAYAGNLGRCLTRSAQRGNHRMAVGTSASTGQEYHAIFYTETQVLEIIRVPRSYRADGDHGAGEPVDEVPDDTRWERTPAITD
jgi:hypothetical protein